MKGRLIILAFFLVSYFGIWVTLHPKCYKALTCKIGSFIYNGTEIR